MTITLVTNERTVLARLPYNGCPWVEVDYPCSGCGAFRIAGSKPHVEEDSKITATAVCLGCRAPCGTLVVSTETLFGLEEDDRMLNGRPRVY